MNFVSEHVEADYSYHDPLQGISEDTKEHIKAGLLRSQLESRLAASSIDDIRSSLEAEHENVDNAVAESVSWVKTLRQYDVDGVSPPKTRPHQSASQPKRIAKARERCAKLITFV